MIDYSVNYRRYWWHKRYAIVFVTKLSTITCTGTKYTEDYEEGFQTDSIDVYKEYLKTLLDKNLKCCVIDRKYKKLLFNNINNESDNYNTYSDYCILEKYIGDNKTIIDFMEFNYNTNIYSTLLNRDKNDMYFQASMKYKEYLNKVWNKH